KMRKAMAERDRRCVWPGCWNRPVECDGHHAELPWAQGGGTNVEEMALACGRHHGMLDRGWRLEKGADGQPVPHPPEDSLPPTGGGLGRGGTVFGPAIHDPPRRAG
ncbi:MAG: HNH endonuclease, partial [Candidatus Dormibacteraeota bacterium]|nr:HNH endonuclease [Candidatus Dormibacteraeota bacterium]